MGSTVSQSDINTFVAWFKTNINLKNAVLPPEYYYSSLPLCVMDCIDSINARYVRPVKLIQNYCSFNGLPLYRVNRNALPPLSSQQPVSALVLDMQNKGLSCYTNNVFKRFQRVKTAKGVYTPKTNLIYDFAGLLLRYNVNYFQDITSILMDNNFEKDALGIPGIADRTLSYFFMLAGDDSTIKFDRWLDRHATMVLGRKINVKYAQNLYSKTSRALRPKYPHVTPRLLENCAWDYTRKSAKAFPKSKTPQTVGKAKP
jgi:hypothetical protein